MPSYFLGFVLIFFVAFLIGCVAAEQSGNPLLSSLGVDANASALQSGAVDAIDYVPWRNYEEVLSNKSLTMYSNPQTISALYLNTKKAPFDNVKVRQAVAMAG